MSDSPKVVPPGNEHAVCAPDDLLPLVYEELRRLASKRLASQPPGHTLQATALVHEAWLRIAHEDHPWENRKQFFSAAAEAMRRVLVDRARRKQRLKRGAGSERAEVDVDSIAIATESTPDELIRVHEALDKLAREDRLKTELIKLRFFVGMGITEAAEVLNISTTTAKRHWSFARAWLYNELRAPSLR